MEHERTTIEKRPRSGFWDILILALVLTATYFIRERAIPYINQVYHYTAAASGFDGLLEGLFRSSPSTWFQTQLYSMELPDYKWYIAVLLALMVQVVASDINSYIDGGWLKRRGMILRILFRVVETYLFTDFMLALTILALLTICPQNSRFLFVVLEAALFCLPALIHWLVRRKNTHTPLHVASSVVNAAIVYIAIDRRSLGTILLLASNFLMDALADRLEGGNEAAADVSLGLAENKEPEKKRAGSRWSGQSPFALAGLILTVAWVCGLGLVIRPFVETRMPTVNVVHEDIEAAGVAALGYDSVILRSDGKAVDQENKVFLEHVTQAVLCDRNTFFLTENGEVWMCRNAGDIPQLFLSGIQWIAGYQDALIAIGEQGELWGFGDMEYYLPEGRMLTEPEIILEGYRLKSGDAGKGHLLLVDEDGVLYSCGENAVGELGLGTQSLDITGPSRVMSGIQSVKAGAGVSYALGTDGTMYAWGRNDVGQLGFGVQRASGRKMTYDINEGETCVTTPRALDFGGAAIRQIAMGAECGFALDEGGNLWVWGKNISRDSIAEPDIRRTEVIYIADNKEQAGVTDQRCYYVREDAQAYRDSIGNMANYEVNRAELVYNPQNWLPEPLEVTNSYIEQLLGSSFLFLQDEAPEEETEEPAVSEILTPKDDRGKHGYLQYGGHTYKLFEEWMYTGNAEVYCESMGGHLLTITSQEEYDFILSAIQAGSDYKSISDFYGIALKYSGSWSWMTGEDTSYIASLGISPAMDNGKGEGYINTRGQINVGAVTKHPFICEWE